MEHGLGHLPFTEKQIVTPTGMFIRHSIWSEVNYLSLFQFIYHYVACRIVTSLRRQDWSWLLILRMDQEWSCLLLTLNILGINNLVISCVVYEVRAQILYRFARGIWLPCIMIRCRFFIIQEALCCLNKCYSLCPNSIYVTPFDWAWYLRKLGRLLKLVVYNKHQCLCGFKSSY